MNKEKKNELAKIIMEMEDKDQAVVLLNFFKDMCDIKEDMVDCLDLLDELVENPNDRETKKELRKIILDSFNEVPRKTNKMIRKLIEKE